MYELKIYSGVMCHDGKFEEELTCQFKIDMRNLANVDPSSQKSKRSAL